MRSRSFIIVRLFESFGIIMSMGAIVAGVWWYFTRGFFGVLEAALLVAVFVVGLAVFLLANRSISRRVDLLMSQCNFAQQAEFLSLFEGSPLPYITIDSKGRIINANQAAIQMLRSSTDRLIGTDLLGRFLDSEESDVSIIANKVKAGIRLKDIKVSLKADNDEEVWVLFSSYANIHNGETLVSLVDVTQAKKVDEAKSEFVALATHQLRTPLAAIRWNVELLSKHMLGSGDEKLDRYITKISTNTGRMNSLINDFLNVSKLELGTFATQTAEINLTQFLDTVVDEFSETFEKKLLRLERAEAQENIIFTADPRLLQIIVSNLLSNAAKYAQDSGTVWLNTSVEDNALRIQVADDGIGIPESEIGSLFSKFYRATNARHHQTEGTGLGLYIVRQAAEQLGGTVTVTSEEGEGAVFLVTLPM